MSTKTTDFDAVRLRLASPKKILEWSYGEVTRPETINYRTQKPEKDGLFCERIFGPTKDFQCYCGKYKKIRYKGIICDKCGVEVTRSIVRRERMGHINLATPVSHIWFLRGRPSSKIGLILDLSAQELEKVVYFGSYIITDVDEEERKKALLETHKEYKARKREVKRKYIELKQEMNKSKVRKKMLKTKRKMVSGEMPSLKETQDINKKMQGELEGLEQAKDKAEEQLIHLSPKTIISELEFRDLSMKYGQVFKASIGTEAIRKLLSRIDLRQEAEKLKKELEEAHESRRKRIMKVLKLTRGMIQAKIRPEWMCLTVIPVIPPDLRPMVQLDGGRFAASDLNDLYRRVINRNNRLKRLQELGAPEVISRNEKRMLQEAVDALLDNSARRSKEVTASTGQRRKLRSLADMLKGKQGRFRQNLLGKRVDYSGRSVIVVGPELNLSECGLPKIMALELFKPFVIAKLISEEFTHSVRSAGKLIEQQDPCVWDMLEEVSKNYPVLLNRAPTLHRLGIQSFKPVLIEGKAIQIHPMVCKAFGADFDGDQMAVHLPLTKEAKKEAEEIMASTSNLLKPAAGDPIVTCDQDLVLGFYYVTHIRSGCHGEGKIFSTPEEAILALGLEMIDIRAEIKVKIKDKLIKTCVGRILFNRALPHDFPFVNKTLGKKEINKILGEIHQKFSQREVAKTVDKIKEMGFKVVSKSGISWGMDDLFSPRDKQTLLELADKQVQKIYRQFREGLLSESERHTKIVNVWFAAQEKIGNSVRKTLLPFGPVYSIIISGARGSWSQVTQMAGMKGLVAGPTGEVIELPVRNSLKDGLSNLEYFISSHGSRKGMSDIALRTSEAGYLTRRMVDVAQDVVIREEDCGDAEGVEVSLDESREMEKEFYLRIRGRVLAADVVKPKNSKEILVKTGTLLDEKLAKMIEDVGVKKVRIRSVLTCKIRGGLCAKCYGWDLSKNRLVKPGLAVGIIAAQAIGEPGTQLTLYSKHRVATAGGDILQGLPRVEELFEAHPPRGKAIISEIDGIVHIEKQERNQKILIQSKDPTKTKEYIIPKQADLLVKNNAKISKGQPLMEGHFDLKDLFRISGKLACQKYILKEVQWVYTSQGQNIDDKHIEMIIRQMFSRIKIQDPRDTDLLPGDIISKDRFLEENSKVKETKGKPAVGQNLILGISKAALSTESFLSAASFQETARVLIEAALTGKKDELLGLKENVIIGKLIPAGTGFRRK